jgi:hypothetical protein
MARKGAKWARRGALGAAGLLGAVARRAATSDCSSGRAVSEFFFQSQYLTSFCGSELRGGAALAGRGCTAVARRLHEPSVRVALTWFTG